MYLVVNVVKLQGVSPAPCRLVGVRGIQLTADGQSRQLVLAVTITPFAALGKAGFATAVLVGLAWVLWLEGKALSRLYNRSFHVAMKLTLLPLAAPVVVLMAAFGIMAGAVLSFLGSVL